MSNSEPRETAGPRFLFSGVAIGSALDELEGVYRKRLRGAESVEGRECAERLTRAHRLAVDTLERVLADTSSRMRRSDDSDPPRGGPSGAGQQPAAPPTARSDPPVPSPASAPMPSRGAEG